MAKRKLNSAPMTDEERGVPQETVQTFESYEEPRGGLVGHQMGHATNDILKKVMDGRVSVVMNTSQIEDTLGSDRKGNWVEDSEFRLLKENIAARGQTQPIRVRPMNPDWRPNQKNPTVIDGAAQFLLLSGRRRLRALQELGVDEVQAIIAPDMKSALDGHEDLTISDLEERYSENAIRQDLTPFERILSIGQIAVRLKHEEDATQAHIAERLGVAQPLVSVGVKCAQNADKALDWFGPKASMDMIRDLAPFLDKRETLAEAKVALAERREKGRGTAAKRAQKTIPGGGTYKLERSGKKVSLTAKGVSIPTVKQEDFERELLDLIQRYRDG
ncbi:ParB N-terminal domain-containing protein [uncultured Limimaricola sp.]|mgnify:FL=1|uniref:ParB/RepB/Spo0J family partition protein n=1 Tax=uncultured Limimaricola sp. TaxID=2211667 RepID=UPI0030FC4AF6